MTAGAQRIQRCRLFGSQRLASWHREQSGGATTAHRSRAAWSVDPRHAISIEPESVDGLAPKPAGRGRAVWLVGNVTAPHEHTARPEGDRESRCAEANGTNALDAMDALRRQARFGVSLPPGAEPADSPASKFATFERSARRSARGFDIDRRLAERDLNGPRWRWRQGPVLATKAHARWTHIVDKTRDRVACVEVVHPTSCRDANHLLGTNIEVGRKAENTRDLGFPSDTENLLSHRKATARPQSRNPRIRRRGGARRGAIDGLRGAAAHSMLVEDAVSTRITTHVDDPALGDLDG